jgi:hypothetical protein
MAMSHLLAMFRGILRLDRWGWAALVAVSLGLSGCCNWNLRGEKFNDETGTQLRQMRKPDNDVRFWGFSNKAREIEQDFGAR